MPILPNGGEILQIFGDAVFGVFFNPRKDRRATAPLPLSLRPTTLASRLARRNADRNTDIVSAGNCLHHGEVQLRQLSASGPGRSISQVIVRLILIS